MSKAKVTVKYHGNLVSENVYDKTSAGEAKGCAEETVDDLGGDSSTGEWQESGDTLVSTFKTNYDPETEEEIDDGGLLVVTIEEVK